MRAAPHEKLGPALSIGFLGGRGTTHRWVNMPALGFLLGATTHITRVDLTDFNQVRLVVNKQATAGAGGSTLQLKYKTGSFSAALIDYVTIGAAGTPVSCAIDTTNTVVSSGWMDLAGEARADVVLAVVGTGGDGVLDPELGSVVAQFRRAL